MEVYVETERLLLRRFTNDDVDNLVELDSDPIFQLRSIVSRSIGE